MIVAGWVLVAFDLATVADIRHCLAVEATDMAVVDSMVAAAGSTVVVADPTVADAGKSR